MSTRPPVKNLDALTDVIITTPTDGQALIYKATSTAWLNQSIPGGSLAALSDAVIVSPADDQVLKYDGVSAKWENYGPLVFSDVTGNINVNQMAGGAGATGATFFRGDGTWASPTGAVPGTTNTVLKSDGLNWLASTETYAAPGTSGNRMVSDGANWISSPPVSTSYLNASTTIQALSAAELYLPGSTITLPAGTWKAGGIYHCTFYVVKTAAGTAGIILTVRMGTLGTISDASIATISFGAGTAVADTGIFDVWINFWSVGSGTSALISLASRCTHQLVSTGLTSLGSGSVAIPAAVGSAGFNSTTATNLGITFTGGAAFNGSNGFVQTEYKQ